MDLSARASAGAQPPRPSAEDEKRKIEAELKRMSQPEVRQEWLLLDDLNKTAESYYSNKDASSRQDCESLLAKVLALPKPSAGAYSTCAAIASMLDRPRQAIEIVKKAIAEYPEEQMEGPILPLRISGYYRIDALATRIGDVNEVVRSYETIIANLGTAKGKEYDTALCYIYLADVICRTAGKERGAAEKLQEVIRIMEGIDKEKRDRNDVFAIDLMKDWAAYELARLEHDGTAPDITATPNGDSLMLAAIWGSISCPSMPEVEQMAESDRPSILRDLAKLALAINCPHASDPFKAEKYLQRVAEGDSYFKAQAKISLDAVHEQIKQMHERVPALLNDLKHGDLEQQEQATSQLQYHSGPEGIKVLENAQADPDKRVRCIAACTLAKSFDRSVKAKFDPILEAFTDEDPRMREMAESAMLFHSGVEIGPKEVTAPARLLHERYSKELMFAVRACFLPLETQPEIISAAAPELARLINHENTEIREGILDILEAMHAPSAQLAAALAQRLDGEQNNDARIRIIEMLRVIGPGAKAAVPVLIKYTRHDDPNIRHMTIEALKEISPANAAGIPETAGEP
jgi:HEAT repeat protein